MDELTLVVVVVGLPHSVWVALSTAECMVGHWLIGGDATKVFLDTTIEGKVLMVTM